MIFFLGYLSRLVGVNHVVKEPCHTSALSGESWIEELLLGSPRRFRNQMRMHPETFEQILDTMVTRKILQSSRYVSAKEKIAIFLFIAGHAASNRQAQERFQRSGWTITKALHVLDALLVIYPEVVVLPDPDVCPWEIHSNPKIYPLFQDCIGALDGTHIPTAPPAGRGKPFRNRKGFQSQNVLAACSFDLRFVYVLTGWEGSASDGGVLKDAMLRKGFSIPAGKMYFGDAGYGLTLNVITPYRGVRYHLREWSLGNQRPQNKKELYNLRHAQQRNCIEQILVF